MTIREKYGDHMVHVYHLAEMAVEQMEEIHKTALARGHITLEEAMYHNTLYIKANTVFSNYDDRRNVRHMGNHWLSGDIIFPKQNNKE